MMTPAAWLILVAGLAHLAPGVLTCVVGGSQAAWDYCMQGIQSAALWLLLASASGMPLILRAVSVWGAIEGAERPICRAMFPMDKAPSLPAGVDLCEAATGIPAGWVGIVAALFVVALHQEITCERG